MNYVSTNTSYNYPGYKSAAYDKLYDAGRVATSVEARATDCSKQAEKQMMTDMPIIPMTDILQHTLVHKRVTGWRANVDYPAEPLSLGRRISQPRGPWFRSDRAITGGNHGGANKDCPAGSGFGVRVPGPHLPALRVHGCRAGRLFREAGGREKTQHPASGRPLLEDRDFPGA
jgi:hypothetical protein